MPAYSISCRSRVQVSSASPAFELRAGPTDYPVLTELGIGLLGGSVGINYIFGIGVPAAVGIGPIAASISPVSEDGSAVGGLNIALDWATRPTVPANFLRRFAVPTDAAAALARSKFLRFPRGIKIAPSSSLVLWCIFGQQGAAQVAVCEMWAGFDA